MPDQPDSERRDQVKPLSLESAILDVAPRVVETKAKAAQPQPTTNRPRPSGRFKLPPAT